MKILALFVNYGTNQSHFLDEILNELDSIPNTIFIKKIFGTQMYNFTQNNTYQYILPESIGVDLTLMPYIFLSQNRDLIDEFDYILYNENDNFITKHNFEHFLYWNTIFEKHGACCGFLRYEINNKDKQHYFLDPISVNEFNFRKIEDIDVFSVTNNHSGCWCFSKQQYLSNIHPNINYIGKTLEDRATNVYKSITWPGSMWGIQKYFPLKYYKDLLIHHMPNKYTNTTNSGHGHLKIQTLFNF